MHHDEFVQDICFTNDDDKRLVSYGFRSTKIWSLPSGGLTATVPNPINVKALAIAVARHGTKVMIGSDDKRILQLDQSDIDQGWRDVDPALLEKTSPIEGGILTSPSFIAFSSDATKVAIAYRRYPLSVWSTQEHHLFARCRRNNPPRSDGARPSVGWMAVDRVAQNPVADVLVGLYKDGSVFIWDSIREEHQEAQSRAHEIQVSPDGKLFITSDSSGIIQVWNFAYLTVIYKLANLIRNVIANDFKTNCLWPELGKVGRETVDVVIPRLMGALEVRLGAKNSCYPNLSLRCIFLLDFADFCTLPGVMDEV